MLRGRMGNGINRASGVDPLQQCLDHARLSGMLQRFALRRDVLRQFSEHLRAQLHQVLFVERNSNI
jgi:hypothetical protein